MLSATAFAVAGIKGDVNSDLRVNVSDVSTLINKILGISEIDDEIADVNGDGRVNVSDVTDLINRILNGIVEKTGYDYVWDYDAKQLPELHIEVSVAEWNRLLTLYDANHQTKQYIMAKRATFIKDGQETVIDSIGLRLKGNTSRRRPEGWGGGWLHMTDNADWHHVHFGINLRKYVKDDEHTIQGVRKLHLKWFKDDPAYVREMYCYDLFRRYGVWTAADDVYCRLWLHVESDSTEAYYG
ncbi:MAG: dockerin type I repeat-containing protein, partial [Muribaculaceae bacterium]|nr:dockerin type I repeat-containing protein [Muribaculaceae bacterium]